MRLSAKADRRGNETSPASYARPQSSLYSNGDHAHAHYDERGMSRCRDYLVSRGPISGRPLSRRSILLRHRDVMSKMTLMDHLDKLLRPTFRIYQIRPVTFSRYSSSRWSAIRNVCSAASAQMYTAFVGVNHPWARMECAALSSPLVSQSWETSSGYGFGERRVRPLCHLYYSQADRAGNQGLRSPPKAAAPSINTGGR
jgi:hypothetical protein